MKSVLYPERARQCFYRQCHWCYVMLRQLGLQQDLHQAIALAALEAERAGMSFTDASRYFGREASRFLKECGFHVRNGARLVVDRQLDNEHKMSEREGKQIIRIGELRCKEFFGRKAA